MLLNKLTNPLASEPDSKSKTSRSLESFRAENETELLDTTEVRRVKVELIISLI